MWYDQIMKDKKRLYTAAEVEVIREKYRLMLDEFMSKFERCPCCNGMYKHLANCEYVSLVEEGLDLRR
jgi:hypothetical protein